MPRYKVTLVRAMVCECALEVDADSRLAAASTAAMMTEGDWLIVDDGDPEIRGVTEVE